MQRSTPLSEIYCADICTRRVEQCARVRGRESVYNLHDEFRAFGCGHRPLECGVQYLNEVRDAFVKYIVLWACLLSARILYYRTSRQQLRLRGTGGEEVDSLCGNVFTKVGPTPATTKSFFPSTPVSVPFNVHAYLATSMFAAALETLYAGVAVLLVVRTSCGLPEPLEMMMIFLSFLSAVAVAGAARRSGRKALMVCATPIAFVLNWIIMV